MPRTRLEFLDDVPDANNALWLVKTIGGNTTNLWSVTDDYPAHSGAFSWHVKEATAASQQILEMNPSSFTFHVVGSRPVLRFYHRYQCEGGISGGMVEVRELGTTSWEQVGDKMLRNGYPDVLYYFTFNAHNVQAFSGNSGNAYRASYVDLSEWAGKDIQIRFRFGNIDGAGGDLGWLIDDIEFMDMLAYNGETCVTSDQGDLECAVAPEAGTIVDSRAEPLDAGEQSKEFAATIYPNPAADRINIALPGEGQQKVNISLLTTDGRSLLEQSLDGCDSDRFYIDTANIPAGLYLVKISSTKGQFAGKVVIQK